MDTTSKLIIICTIHIVNCWHQHRIGTRKDVTSNWKIRAISKKMHSRIGAQRERGSDFAKGQRRSRRGEIDSELPPWRKGNATVQDSVAEKGKCSLRIQKESSRVFDGGFAKDSERGLEGFGERIMNFVS